ncbi:hypothetical protein Aca07nite_27770 [Actinoplanes capillaceus]|uniref:Uncharacterized protein n=1 Tax=Actinoplanes campanulatus TaxID=113559 RepID=A0ABQ3WGY7_9ACTN|nr:hypothetical protein [Actinoplanes capillaceus]GID45502.1 hypothetical protein Aca07nite_27770 [Actinoplanes capillaceus]
MTAATTTRSAYPRAVEDLLPHARDLAEKLGETPSRNLLMKTFRVGRDKANALLAALTPAPAASVVPEQVPPIDPADEMAWVRPFTESPTAADPNRDYEAEREAMIAAAQATLAEMDGPPFGEDFEPAEPSPIERAAEPEAERPRRSVRPAAVTALITSAAAAITGGVLAVRFAPVPPENLTVMVIAAVAALAVLMVFAWSAGSVLGAVFSGRSGRDVALDVASWLVAGVAGFLAAYGQVKFAEWATVTGPERFLVPGILEPAVVVLLLLANRRVKRRWAGHPAKPIGKLLALAALLGGFAVYTNVVHAGGRAGLVFGAATVVGLILWWVKLQDDAAPDMVDDEPQSKRLSRRTSRYRLLRWAILFGQTRRAWLISLDHSIADAEVGLDLARRWRRAYDEARDAKTPRRRARQHASRHIDAYLISQH